MIIMYFFPNCKNNTDDKLNMKKKKKKILELIYERVENVHE